MLAAAEMRLAALALRLDLDRKAGTVGERPLPGVALVAALDPPTLVGWWGPDLAEKAGARAVLAESGRPPRVVDLDELVKGEPEVVVLALDGVPVHENVDRVTGGVDWRALRAVREGRVFALDGSRYVRSPAPGLVRGVELIARAVHGRRAGVAVESGELVGI